VSDSETLREAVRADILRAFGLKPWDIGLAPVPWRVKLWRTVTFARLRIRLADGPCLLRHRWCDCNDHCPQHAEDTFRCTGYGGCTSPHPGSAPAHCARCEYEPPGQRRT
jgi:hypothetical protein